MKYDEIIDMSFVEGLKTSGKQDILALNKIDGMKRDARRVADAVHSLVGLDLEGDEVSPGTADDDAAGGDGGADGGGAGDSGAAATR